MKIKCLYIFVLSCLLCLITNCDKKQEEAVDEEDQEASISLLRTVLYPFDGATVYVRGLNVTKDAYDGTVGSNTFTAFRTSNDELDFTVPQLDEGTYTLRLTVESEILEKEIEIKAFPSIENPQEIITQTVTQLNDYLSGIENDQYLSADNKLLFREIVNEFNRQMSVATETEKLLFAQYCSVHPELFEGIPEIMQHSSVITRDMLKQNLFTYIKEVEKLTYAAGITGLALWATPTAVEKLLALAIGGTVTYNLFQKVKKLHDELLSLHIIPQEIFLRLIDVSNAPPVNGTKFNNSVSDLRIWEHETVGSAYASYRTLCNRDEDNPKLSSELSQLIDAMYEFNAIWAKINSKVAKIIDFFNLRGVFPGAPKKLSEITTYSTEENLMNNDEWTIGIISGDVRFSVSDQSFVSVSKSADDMAFEFVLQDKNGTKSITYSAILQIFPFTCDIEALEYSLSAYSSDPYFSGKYKLSYKVKDNYSGNREEILSGLEIYGGGVGVSYFLDSDGNMSNGYEKGITEIIYPEDLSFDKAHQTATFSVYRKINKENELWSSIYQGCNKPGPNGSYRVFFDYQYLNGKTGVFGAMYSCAKFPDGSDRMIYIR
jgi:hypothetical protein